MLHYNDIIDKDDTETDNIFYIDEGIWNGTGLYVLRFGLLYNIETTEPSFRKRYILLVRVECISFTVLQDTRRRRG